MTEAEKRMVRRHTFFCVNKARHTANETTVETVPKRITIYGRQVDGWLVTTEEPLIDKHIPWRESLRGDVIRNDPE